MDAAARARDPRIGQVSVALAGSWSVVEIVRADGFLATDIRPLVRLNVSIVVEENGRRESGYFGLGGRYMYDHLFEPAQWNRAIDRKSVVSGKSVSVRVDLGGRRTIKTKKTQHTSNPTGRTQYNTI